MPKSPPIRVSADQQRRRIAEAAYYRAERRGFTGGNPVEDWLEAEQEIQQLATQPTLPRTALVFLEKDLPAPATRN